MPAIRPARSTSMRPVPPLSLAGQLPQGLKGTRKSSTTQKPVGAGLPAIRPARSASMLPVPPLSLAGQLPHGVKGTRKSSTTQKPVGAGLPAIRPSGSTPLSAQGTGQKRRGPALFAGSHFLRRACHDNFAALISRPGADVDHPVALRNHAHFMFDHDDRVPRFH